MPISKSTQLGFSAYYPCMSGFRHTLFDHLYRATVDSSTSISGHRFFFQGYDRVYQKMTVDSLPGCSLVSYLIA